MGRLDPGQVELELGQLVQGRLDRAGHDLNAAGQAGRRRGEQSDRGGEHLAGRGDRGDDRGWRRLAGLEHADDRVFRLAEADHVVDRLSPPAARIGPEPMAKYFPSLIAQPAYWLARQACTG